MNSSNLFKGIIVVMLLLSIAWKISVRPDNQLDLTNNLIQFLESRHFSIVVTRQLIDYMPLIQADRSACRLKVARLTPDGSNRDLFQHFADGGDRLFVIFDGHVYDRQPVFWTVMSYLSSRFLRELGLRKHITPVIAVAASPDCNAESLPWRQLRLE